MQQTSTTCFRARIASLLGYNHRPVATGPKGWLIDLMLLGARIFACVWMIGAGLDKIPTPDWMVDQVAGIGFPAPRFFALCAEMSEYAGGVLLLFGLFSRPAAFFLAFTMGTAALGFHRVNPFVEYHITLGFFWLYIVLLATGPGRFSLDAMLSRIFTTRATPDLIRRRPVAYLATGVLLATPVLGYGLYREFTMTWTPSAAEAGISLDGVNTIAVAGSFNAWDLNANQLTAEDGGIWATSVELPTGITEFKFVANANWDMSMGDADQTDTIVPFTGAGDLDAANISANITTAGLYRIMLDGNDFSYRIEPAVPLAPPETNRLIGTWRVDLRPTPEADPYLIDLEVSDIADGKITGTFYNGSPITQSRVTNTFGVVRFAFVTEDGSGPYHTSGEIIGDTITGITHSLGRDFVMPWRGERVTTP